MASSSSAPSLDAFMEGPVLKWLRTLPDAPKELTFDELVGGTFLHHVLHSFGDGGGGSSDFPPLPNPSQSSASSSSGYRAKVENAEAIVKKIRAFYQDVLGQCLVVRPPDPLQLCAEPATSSTLREAEVLLTLVVGAAAQCPQREHFIQSIKVMPVEVQQDIAERIQKVTDESSPSYVWSSFLDSPPSPTQRESLFPVLVQHVKRVADERDQLARKLVQVSLATPSTSESDEAAATSSATSSGGKSGSSSLTPEKTHLALEAAEYKAKIRKLNQQLEEKTEGLLEAREELEKYVAQASKLRQENLELAQEARAGKAFRDELDILRERANKVDKLEAEMQRYKDRVSDIEFYRSRVDELREDNRILVETKEMLEQQLEGSRKRCESVFSLENEILRYKSELNSIQLERDQDRLRSEELERENAALQMSARGSLSENRNLSEEIEALRGTTRGKDTNILTEQIDKDVTKIHRLELENQKLLSELETLKRDGFQETSERILALEKENKKLSMTAKQLEELHSKDSEYNVELERRSGQLETKCQQLEEVVGTLRTSEEQLRIEKETEVENLQKHVESLRRRQEQSMNEQVSLLEAENRKLVKEHTLLQTQVGKLERETKRSDSKLKEVQSELGSAQEELRAEKERLNSRLEQLAKEAEELKSFREENAGVSEARERLEKENVKIKNNADKLRTDNNELRIENARLSSELGSASRRADSLRAESQRAQTLEAERDELREAVAKLKREAEATAAAGRRGEEQEQRLHSLTAERNKLERQLQTLQRRVEELTADHTSLDQENKKMAKNIETLKATARKVEQLEKENVDLESSQHKVERENKSLSKEVDRLKQSIDVKDASIDDMQSKLSTAERERTRLFNDLEQLSSESSRIQSLEQENRKLNQTCSIDKRSLVKLREELVAEKLSKDTVSTEFEGLKRQLSKLGVDWSAVMEGDADAAVSVGGVSEERVRSLEGSMSALVDSGRKRVASLELALKEATEERSKWQQRAELLELKAAAGDSRAGLEAQMAKVVRDRDSVQSELLTAQIEVNSSKEKISLYESKLKKLQAEQVNIQVENSTLQSQSTSLLSQINQLQTTLSALESGKRKFEETEKRWSRERADLLQDQQAIQKLHDNLQQDYEALAKEKEAQKEVERRLRADLRKLQSMSLTFSEDQDNLLRQQEAINKERESLRTDARTMSNLRAEHARLKDDFRSLFTSNERVKGEYCGLQNDYKALKTSYNQLKLQETERKGELNEAREQLTLLDVEHSKAANRCEVLSQMNTSLEEDRRSLMQQVSILLTQYHDLLTQTLEDKEHFHEEEKEYTDKVNNLNRQKEKLEEKIMEQYKKMENSPPKRLSFGGQIVRKIHKAGSNIIGTGNRNRSGSRGRVGQPGPSNGNSSSNSLARQQQQQQAGQRRGEDAMSSSCSSGNDSMDSGQHSPNGGMARSESAVELRGRRMSNGAAGPSSGVAMGGDAAMAAPSPAGSALLFRKSMPPPSSSHLEDSDGNNADNDSVNSFMSSGNGFLAHIAERQVYLEGDGLSNRDTSQSSYSHSELGLPKSVPPRPGSGISRVYVNGGGGGSDAESTRSQHQPNLTSRKIVTKEEDPLSPPPTIPSRKSSRGPPQRPPKPGRPRGGIYHDDYTGSQDGDDSSSTVDDESAAAKKENTEWYEYGCV